MQRYSAIDNKRKREIVLLRGRGCIYKKCVFCDYYLDSSKDDKANFEINKDTLDKVSGVYGDLEVINSGSVFELDDATLDYIDKVCREKGIRTLHFEAHYLYRDRIPQLRERFKEFHLKLKLGLETFDYHLREELLRKGIAEKNTKEISRGFDEVNLLFGLSGQSVESMQNDIQLALENFERVCVNIMCDNTTSVKPDKKVIREFMQVIYPAYIQNERVDILINNTDFGVGD
ncbi:MAG: radical SAM protein [Clostridia bacterium]|nr:radical SAM protein [Clostridia bacterium]